MNDQRFNTIRELCKLCNGTGKLHGGQKQTKHGLKYYSQDCECKPFSMAGALLLICQQCKKNTVIKKQAHMPEEAVKAYSPCGRCCGNTVIGIPDCMVYYDANNNVLNRKELGLGEAI